MTGHLLLGFVCLVFSLASLLFLYGSALSPPVVYVSSFITMVWGWRLASKEHGIRIYSLALLLFFLVILLSYGLAFFIYDVSYDGQTYHQEAIIQLAGGWNPFAETLIPRTMGENFLFRCINHYPKATEIVQAGVYLIARRIEPAKLVNLLLMAAAFFLTAAALLDVKGFGVKKALSISLLAALNPVAVYQSLTFYVDGNLASLILCLASLLYLYYLRPNWQTGSLIVLAGVFMINIKFTAAVYFVLFFLAYFFILFIGSKRSLLPKAAILFACSLILGGTLFGYNPYVLNYRNHGHVFHPVMGSDKFDVIIGQRPGSEGFQALNNPERFLASLFSEGSVREYRLKIPFMASPGELLAYTYPDPRLGGFGPFFGAACVLTAFLLLMGLVNAKRNAYLYILISITTFSVIINPEAWWARFVPQFWLVPVMTLAFLEVDKDVPWKRALYRGLAVLLVVNVALVAGVFMAKRVWDTRLLQHELRQLAKMEMPLQIHFHAFRSNRVRLMEAGLSYEEMEAYPERHYLRMPFSEARMLAPLEPEE